MSGPARVPFVQLNVPDDVARRLWGHRTGAQVRAAAAAAQKHHLVPKATANAAPAIHSDRLYVGYDVGLGCYTHGKAHRREIMRAKGLRAVHGGLSD